MFIAQREIKVIGRDDKVVVFKPGEEIEGFDTWELNAQRSHLNLEWVKKVEGATKKAPSASPKAPEKKAPKKAPKVQDKKEQPVVEAPVAPAVVKCAACAKEFKTEKALKTHTTLAHK